MTPRTASPASFIEVLDRWATRSPDRAACRFLSFGSAPEHGVTYAELVAHARAIGAALQTRVRRGDRVILLYPPSLAFVTAFLGSFHAGAIAVPAYPPEPLRMARALPRLQAIMRDAEPELVLTTTSLLSTIGGSVSQALGIDACHFVERCAPASHRLFVLRAARLLVIGHVEFDRFEQTDHLLFADLHRATNAVIGATVGAYRFDQVLATKHQTGRLGASQILTAAKDRQGCPHLRPLP